MLARGRGHEPGNHNGRSGRGANGRSYHDSHGATAPLLPGVVPEAFIPDLQAHVKREYMKVDRKMGQWETLPEIPTSAEILGNAPTRQSENDNYDDDNDDDDKSPSGQLPYNVVYGPWKSKEMYIEAHYRLLREDGIGPLRNAVAVVRKCPSMDDSIGLYIYEKVHIIGYTFSLMGAAPRVEFSTARAGKRIRWKQSKRLQQGTVVALTTTSDKFKSICRVAIVAARSIQGVEQNPPQIDLFWGDPMESEFDPSEEFIMVEARTGYFEASRHMLVAMQKLMTEAFPLSDYLIGVEHDIGPPECIKRNPLTNMKALLPPQSADICQPPGCSLVDKHAALENVNILGSWPKIDGVTLDDSQMAALKRILSKKVAIVQGPPGTGKTFVSISALKVILDNWTPKDPPVIVSAQTNHALDQLLMLLADTEPNFVRLGGRTTRDSKVIHERTLFSLRALAAQGSRAPIGSWIKAKKALESQAIILKTVIRNSIDQGQDEVNILHKLGVITDSQLQSLIDENYSLIAEPDLPLNRVTYITQWLTAQQRVEPPKCPPDSLGFGDDESEPDFEELEEIEQEVVKHEDDIETLRGQWFPFRESFTGRRNFRLSNPDQMKRFLATKHSLYDIPVGDRGEVYRYFRSHLKREMMKGFRHNMADYLVHTENIKIARWQSDATFIRRTGVKLIGCTTTGLSKYRGLLASLKPHILLIEEAAETLEGTVLAANFESLQQLILIGDHQQLQAQCNDSSLEKAPYNLSVSMFERLINNGTEFTMLNRQRRMIAELRELLNPFYPDLRDHMSVHDRVTYRQPIPGMGGLDSYFFSHTWPESRDEALSRYNTLEAEMIVGFFVYLKFNGVKPSKITILTFYNGQRKVLLNLLRRNNNLKDAGPRFNVFTVDSYQGEENDVILLSLVRSNAHHNIGFLENKNRVVVALSRARRGMYIFGDALNLHMSSNASFELWKTVTGTMRSKGSFDYAHPGLPIMCNKHKTRTMVKHADDWVGNAGGCDKICGGLLTCGHRCVLNCHPFPDEMVLCKQPCLNKLPCGHGCSERCGDRCRCPCDNAATQQVFPALPRDGIWPLSLDDTLNDGPSKNYNLERQTPDNQYLLSRGQNKSANSNYNTGSFKPPQVIVENGSAWHDWNDNSGKIHDQQMENNRADANLGRLHVNAPFPQVFNETFVPVTIEGGSRISKRDNTTKTLIDTKFGLSSNTNALLSRQPQLPANSSVEYVKFRALKPTPHRQSVPGLEQLDTNSWDPKVLAIQPPTPVNLSNIEPAPEYSVLLLEEGFEQLNPVSNTKSIAHSRQNSRVVLGAPSVALDNSENLINFD